MKDFGSSDVSDDMVLGKDENIFCVADAQTAIKRLAAEPKITVILSNEGDRSAALLALLMKYYLLCQCGTTPITYAVLLLFFFLLLPTLPAPCAWVTSFLVEPEDTGNMMEVNELTCRQVLLTPMTAKADGEAFIMDGFVRRKGGAGDRTKADGGERFRILTGKRKNIEKIIGKLTQKS